MTPPRDLIHWVERYHAGELTPQRRAWLEEQCKARALDLEHMCLALDRDNEAILARYPIDEHRPHIEARRANESAHAASSFGKTIWARRRHIAACAVVCASLSIIWFQWPALQTDHQSDPIGVRTKGTHGTLAVWLNTKQGPRLLRQGDALKQGDQIQLHYHSAGLEHGVILSLDGRGVITDHGPEEQRSVLKAIEGVVANSYILDDAPGYERFFWFTSNKTLDRDALKQSIKALYQKGQGRRGAPKYAKHITMSSITLEKSP